MTADIQTITDACDALIESSEKDFGGKFLVSSTTRKLGDVDFDSEVYVSIPGLDAEENCFVCIAANTASPIAQALKVCMEALQMLRVAVNDKVEDPGAVGFIDRKIAEAAKLIR